jgi:hypothetical protein
MACSVVVRLGDQCSVFGWMRHRLMSAACPALAGPSLTLRVLREGSPGRATGVRSQKEDEVGTSEDQIGWGGLSPPQSVSYCCQKNLHSANIIEQMVYGVKGDANWGRAATELPACSQRPTGVEQNAAAPQECSPALRRTQCGASAARDGGWSIEDSHS